MHDSAQARFRLPGPFCLVALVVLAACADRDEATPASVEALLEAGTHEAAADRARELIREDPSDASLRVLLGRVYLAEGDGTAAEAAFSRAADLGASEDALRRPRVESLLLQREHERVVDVLPASLDRAELDDGLIDLRLRALLRIPLASPRDLFLDAKHRLVGSGAAAATDLERLTDAAGVIEANADQVRREIAFWSCQQPLPDTEPAPELYVPDWADLEVADRRVLRVGPSHALEAPSAASRVARDGDIVEIEAGTYEGDVAVWRADGLWIRSVGGMAVLESGGATADDMGIWVMRGNNAVIEGVRFVGARATHKNGSGIRLLAHNVWIRESEFHDNEAGLLTFNEPGGEVLVEHSVFTENGAGDGFSHNVYIGRTDRLVFRFNYSAGARIGHQLKSRARENYILYNRLADEADGNSSYTIDLSEGGFALVMGNELQQGPETVNRHMISLGAEEAAGRDHRFILAFNTIYNNTIPATHIRDATGAGVALLNNVFAGAPAALDSTSTHRVGNVPNVNLADARRGDYGLRADSPVIDGAEVVPAVDGIATVPEFEYVHPAGSAPRREVYRPDPGAHEYCGWPEY